MKLREKFKQCRNKRNTYYVLPIIEDIEQLESIADDYAIEFAEWCNELRIHGQGYYEKNLKELLEIFKKEKGL